LKGMEQFRGKKNNMECYLALLEIRHQLDTLITIVNESGDNKFRKLSMEGNIHFLKEELDKIPEKYFYESMNELLARTFKNAGEKKDG